MLLYAIDDEKIALCELCDVLRQALPEAEIERFSDTSKAIEEIRISEQKPDVVFSDICKPGINGLELAVRVKKLSPETKIIFVTGYSEYSLDAFKVHANGYLLKPVQPAQIREEIEVMGLPLACLPKKLCVQCFGSFEVFSGGKPLKFRRRRTKELLAYLIDHAGASCAAEDIIAALWEGETNIRNAKHNLRNLLNDLREALKSVGAEEVLIRRSGVIAIDKDAIDCDYFRMLSGDMSAVNAYRGEYMKQYSWAQETEEMLFFSKNDNENAKKI